MGPNEMDIVTALELGLFLLTITGKVLKSYKSLTMLETLQKEGKNDRHSEWLKQCILN